MKDKIKNIIISKRTTILIFGIYMFLLIWLILFKFVTSLDDLSHLRNLNLIPFHGSMIVNGKLNFREIIYNILVFVPLGVYINIFYHKWPWYKKVAICLGISLFFETAQYVFAIGASDITDLIDNTLGGICGIVLANLFMRMSKEKYMFIINIIGGVIELLAIFLIVILKLSN